MIRKRVPSWLGFGGKDTWVQADFISALWRPQLNAWFGLVLSLTKATTSPLAIGLVEVCQGFPPFADHHSGHEK